MLRCGENEKYVRTILCMDFHIEKHGKAAIRKISRSYKLPLLLPKNVTSMHNTKKNLLRLLLL